MSSATHVRDLDERGLGLLRHAVALLDGTLGRNRGPGEAHTFWIRVLELTDRRGVDYVLDASGTGTIERSVNAVRFAGTILTIGMLPGAKTEIPLPQIFMRSITVRGLFAGSRVTLEAMNRGVPHYKLRPIVDKVFPFDQTPDAFRLK